MNKGNNVILMALALYAASATYVRAGPPLVTDDPGILDTGTWEIIAAVAGESRPLGDVYHAPAMDVSLGTSRTTQVSFFLPHTVIDTDEQPGQSGLGFATAGFKWQFASSRSWEWALAANYTFPVAYDLVDKDGPEDIQVVSLPLLVALTGGGLTWNAQLGWNSTDNGFTYWDYGLAAGLELGNRLQLMAEVFGAAGSEFEQPTLNYQVGMDFEMVRDVHLLAAAGSRINEGPERIARLDYCFYLGIQWFV